ncbi:Pbp2 protein [Maudiozyma humilis]|uniref:Pbp2 protein n=1 Tax=Maudiozyma humilis TaxID=51915 RepID=A0AAV5S346_MAUHU|nr:Pbp2 protein [Kazachstania humilis]
MSSTAPGGAGNNLKRKNEAAGEEPELEAAIKRVALEEGDASDGNGNGNDDNESGKDAAAAEVTLRMLCLVREASAVVGPKGETISRLKSESGARINVSENARGVPERVVYVRGSCEDVAKAFGQVSRVLAGLQRVRGVSEETSGADSTLVSVHLLIPHHLMGYVIGKHGSQLRNIEAKSNAELSASPYQLLPSNDRILRVLGVPDAVHIAAYYIAQVLLTFSETHQRGRKTVFYQPGPNHAVLAAGAAAGTSVAAGAFLPGFTSGQELPRMPNGYKVRRQLPRPTSNGAAVQETPGRSTSNSSASEGPVYTAETAANARSFIPEFQIPNVRIATTRTPGQGEGNGSTSSGSASSNGSTLQEVYIEERFVGNVIGREGKHINSIKESTGCAIFIDGPAPGATERRMTIRGSLMASQAAILLISNKIDRDRSRSNSHAHAAQ